MSVHRHLRMVEVVNRYIVEVLHLRVETIEVVLRIVAVVVRHIVVAPHRVRVRAVVTAEAHRTREVAHAPHIRVVAEIRVADSFNA